MSLRSYKYRLDENNAQRAAIDDMLADFCRLRNAALEERINAYRPIANAQYETVWGEWEDRKGKKRQGYVRRKLTKLPKAAVKQHCINAKLPGAKTPSGIDQINYLPKLREACPELARWSYTAEQQVLRDLNITFNAFFKRCREGNKKPGFPRFKAVHRHHAAKFRFGDGLRIEDGRLHIVGVPGGIKVRWHRQLPTVRGLPSVPTTAILTRQCGKLHVVFSVEVEDVERASPDSVALDLGLTSLIATSNGETVPRPKWVKRAEKKKRRQQRAIARCKKGSKTRRKRCALKRKTEAHVAAKRRDFLHFLSFVLVSLFGRIALEDLNIKGLAAGMLAKHVNDAAWGILVNMLIYKAASAGVQLVFVDPRGTSQTCPGCGLIVAKELDEREHRCECGVVLDRDVAAAMIVHYRAFGFWQWPGTGPAALSKRVASRLAAEAVPLQGTVVHE